MFGLVGPNGAGKSTLMRILATLIRPNAGQVLLDGADIQKHPPDAMRRLLGYLPQDVAVYPNLTATEYLQYVARMSALYRLGSYDKKEPMTVIDSRLSALYLSAWRLITDL